MPLVKADRDRLIEQYARGPARLEQALANVPSAALQWRPTPAEWSAHEIIVHCADSESNAYARIRYLVTEKDALIVGYDQEAWARRFDYHALPLDPALATVKAVRAMTAELIRRLPDEAPGCATRRPTRGRCRG